MEYLQSRDADDASDEDLENEGTQLVDNDSIIDFDEDGTPVIHTQTDAKPVGPTSIVE